MADHFPHPVAMTTFQKQSIYSCARTEESLCRSARSSVLYMSAPCSLRLAAITSSLLSAPAPVTLGPLVTPACHHSLLELIEGLVLEDLGKVLRARFNEV